MKDLKISLLLDFYGNLLSEKQLFIMEQYYQEDLSLSEIADIAKMTRQGVHDNIKRAGAELKSYENQLGLLERFMDINDAADKIRKMISPGATIDDVAFKEICGQLDIIKNEA